MIETLKQWDESLFLWLNSYHTDGLDPIVFQLTETITWLPLFLFLIFMIYRVDPRNSWWVFGGVMLTILVSDQVTSGLMKPFFERLRPCHDERWEGIIHNFGRCGGLYGFASSHAANTVGLAVFLNRKLKDKLPWLRWLYVYAFLVSYTRIYLGVHYPADVLIGALVGIIAAWSSWFFVVFVKREILKKMLK